MDEFRRQGILSDIILVVDNEEFPAHKSVLAASSEYFLSLFTSDMKEKTESQSETRGI